MEPGTHVRRTTTVNWPEVVDRRLDYLRELATEAGERVSRAELLGALVSHAPLDGEGLGVMVRAYRRMTMSELSPPATAPLAPRTGRPRTR